MYRILILSLLITLFLIPCLHARSPWTGRDKVMHLLGSAYLVYWNYHLNREVFDNTHNDSLIISVSITSLVGTGKELSDKYYKKTRFCWYDMAYNAAGIILGVLVIRQTR